MTLLRSSPAQLTTLSRSTLQARMEMLIQEYDRAFVLAGDSTWLARFLEWTRT
jgi:hypothetical protein